MDEQQVATLATTSVPVRKRDLVVVRVLNITSNTTIQFGGRILKEDGTQTDINDQKGLAPSGVTQEFTIPMVNGWLMSFQVNEQDATIAIAPVPF